MTKFPSLNLKKVLSDAQLPALPQSAIRLLELSQDPSNGPAEFAVPIETDPGLAGQVLRFVNSSYFGFSREISSVKSAITLVGIRTVKNFALWSAVFSLMPNPKCGPFDLKGLWQDSLRRALFARILGKLLGIEEAEEVFSAGLLQDMAVPMLAKEAPDAYAKLLQALGRGQVRLSELEQHVFGWNHAQAGGIMARNWKLPDAFAVLIENHLDIDRWVSESKSEPGRLAVALSALLPTAGDSVWHECSRLESYYDEVIPEGEPRLPSVLEQVDAEFCEFAPVLKLANVGKSLVDVYNESTAAVS
jgi:HD-like signal output (HDOD) protein